MVSKRVRSCLLQPINTVKIQTLTQEKPWNRRRKDELLLGMLQKLCISVHFSCIFTCFKLTYFRCDRILWRGNGVQQLSYMRWESKFSDHRPVSSMFTVNVQVKSVKAKFRKGYSCAADRVQYRDCSPPRRSVYDIWQNPKPYGLFFCKI